MKLVEECSKAIQCMLLMDNNEQDNYQIEKFRTKGKFKDLISKIFENSIEFDNLPIKSKLEIAKSLKGHNNNKCSEMCEHLKRAMRIKFKYRGKRYPIKVIKM